MAFFFILTIFLSFACDDGELQLPHHEDCQSGVHCRRKQNLTNCPAGILGIIYQRSLASLECFSVTYSSTTNVARH